MTGEEAFGSTFLIVLLIGIVVFIFYDYFFSTTSPSDRTKEKGTGGLSYPLDDAKDTIGSALTTDKKSDVEMSDVKSSTESTSSAIPPLNIEDEASCQDTRDSYYDLCDPVGWYVGADFCDEETKG